MGLEQEVWPIENMRLHARERQNESTLRFEPTGKQHRLPVLLPQSGIDPRGYPRYTAHVLVANSLECEVRRRPGFPLQCRVSPVGTRSRPFRAQPAFMGVRILDDQAAYAAWPPRSKKEPGRCPEIMKVEMESLDSQLREQLFDQIGKT